MFAYDSVRPEDIPRSAAAILPYGDGKFAWTQAQLGLFPHAARRFITVVGDARFAIADVERGDVPASVQHRATQMSKGHPTLAAAAKATGTDHTDPAAVALAARAVTAAGYIRARAALNRPWPPVIYCSRATLAPVQAHCAGLEYGVILATLDGSRPRWYSGADMFGIQFENQPGFDVTEIYRPGWLIQPGQ